MNNFLTLVAIAMLFVVFALVWDGVAAIRHWRGLRLTPLAPQFAFGLATLASVSYLAVLWVTPQPQTTTALSLLAIPVVLLLVVVRGRAVQPLAWTQAGIWDTHTLSVVAIPAGATTIPALFYEPIHGTDSAVVVLHGSGAHKSFYSWPLVEGLLDAGIAVCAIDIDGHGDNQRTLDFPDVLENVATSVAWLRERASWVGVVGISLGGCIAARAIADGTPVDALALLEAPADVQITRSTVRHERWTLTRSATWELHRYAGTLPLIQGWRTAPIRTRIGTIDLIRRLDLPNSLPQITCPLLLVYGTNDQVVPLSQGRMLAEAAPPGTPFVEINGATHLSLPIDRRASRAVSDWLRTINAYGLRADAHEPAI